MEARRHSSHTITSHSDAMIDRGSDAFAGVQAELLETNLPRAQDELREACGEG
jgi:hypothetical protein